MRNPSEERGNLTLPVFCVNCDFQSGRPVDSHELYALILNSKMNILMKKVLYIDPVTQRGQEFDILVSGSRIKRIAKGISQGDGIHIDGRGQLIFPGLVEAHAHFREPGQEHKETIATGMQAAAAGGYTTVLTEPNTNPPIDTPARLKQVLSMARNVDLVNFYSKACISKGQKGKTLTDIEKLKAAGAVALTDDGHPVPGKKLMYNAFMKAKIYDLLLCPHSEESEFYRNCMRRKNRSQMSFFPEGMPYSTEPYRSEPGFIRRDLDLVRRTGARYHVSHVSMAESVEEIAKAKREGLPVTAEVTPHHLLLTEDDAKRIGPNAKVNPPLRSREDTERLKSALAEGVIDIIATDHAPHGPQEKTLPWDEAPFGIIGLETALGLALTFLVKPGLLTLGQLAKKMSLLPAEIFGLKGTNIEEGGEADLTLIDPHQKWIVDASRFYSKGRNCPFHGWELEGKAVMTLVRGRIVMKDGHVIKTEEDLQKVLN